jgi:hypothetical protein|tara:strand:- start:200 stop:667 length:468 start_codon:yes stop_codon:yes gene_type:complete
MSKEEYLKGEQKLQAITIIKTGLAVRMRPKEILSQLTKKGIVIGERTLRRLKLEIYENAGESIYDIYKKQIGGSLFDEIISYEEMERQCWQMYFQANKPQDKIRAIAQLRMVSQDKMKLSRNFPINIKSEKINYTQLRDDLKELDDEGGSKTNSS